MTIPADIPIHALMMRFSGKKIKPRAAHTIKPNTIPNPILDLLFPSFYFSNGYPYLRFSKNSLSKHEEIFKHALCNALRLIWHQTRID